MDRLDARELLAEVGTAYRFTPRDSFTQQIHSSFVGVIVGPGEAPYKTPGVWVRVWRHAFDDELTMRLDGPGYAEGWPLVEPAPYTPTLPDRYLESRVVGSECVMSGLNEPQRSPAWCSCGNWLIGSEHSCDDCEEPDWKAHNDCGHNRKKASA